MLLGGPSVTVRAVGTAKPFPSCGALTGGTASRRAAREDAGVARPSPARRLPWGQWSLPGWVQRLCGARERWGMLGRLAVSPDDCPSMMRVLLRLEGCDADPAVQPPRLCGADPGRSPGCGRRPRGPAGHPQAPGRPSSGGHLRPWPGGGDRPAVRWGVHRHPPSRPGLAGHGPGAVRGPAAGGGHPAPARRGPSPGDLFQPGPGPGQRPGPAATAARALGAGAGVHRRPGQPGLCAGGVWPLGDRGAGRAGGVGGQRAGHQRGGARPRGPGAAAGRAGVAAAGGGHRPGPEPDAGPGGQEWGRGWAGPGDCWPAGHRLGGAPGRGWRQGGLVHPGAAGPGPGPGRPRPAICRRGAPWPPWP
jgi:hypothetical protein